MQDIVFRTARCISAKREFYLRYSPQSPLLSRHSAQPQRATTLDSRKAERHTTRMGGKTPGQRYRTVFDRVATRYDRVRPAPPTALMDAVFERYGLVAGDRVLEVGCGTGQATRLLAEWGLRVHALELGPQLAERARHNLRGFPEVTVQTVAFEAYEITQPFDALVSVQAFHWLAPQQGLALASSALRPGGPLLLAWHQDHSENTPFYRATQPIYRRYPAPPRPTPRHSVGRLEHALTLSPLFTDVATARFPWRRRFNKRDYLDLLLTTSDVQALSEALRRNFLAEIAQTIDRYGGKVERHYESVLLSAEQTL